MGRFLGITGTPGTGKKTLAPRVARVLGVPCVGLNDLITKAEMVRSSGSVDTTKLRRRLMKRAFGRTVVFGHLLPDTLRRDDLEKVVVLRCEPATLKRRLFSRGYPPTKLSSDVETELIGVVSAACISKFGEMRVSEFDTTARDATSSTKSVARILEGRAAGKRIDWMRSYSSAEKLRSLLSDARTDSAFT